MSDSPGLDGVPRSRTVSNNIDMAEGYDSRSFDPGAFRDTSTAFSSRSSSVVSSHSSASSLISFYAEAEAPNQMALVPYISPESAAFPPLPVVPMQRRVIDSFKDRLSTWSEEERLYFEHHDAVFTRLVTGNPPHFPFTGYTSSLRSEIRHLSIIAPQYPRSYTRSKPVAADNEYERAWRESHFDDHRDWLEYGRAWHAIRIAYGDNGCQPIFYFPIASFTPSRSSKRAWGVFTPNGILRGDFYDEITPAPLNEYPRNLGTGPRKHFSILGAHYDRREDYIDRYPHDSPVRQDLAIRFMYEETAEVELCGEVFFVPITKFVFRRNSDLSFIEIYGTVANYGVTNRYSVPQNVSSCLSKKSFTAMVKRFRLPTDSERVDLRGQPLGPLEVLIDRHSGRALYRKASRNMVEEEAFVLWLKTSTRNEYWSKDWFDFYSCFIDSSAAARRVWTPDFDARVEWAFYDLPDISWDVELIYGGLNSSGYWQGMVRWFHG
ncbi:hypothetical protein BT96DRAFT_1008892 [Gymnopus androsaceus JB14]|uniref:Uncharacterized protein n=1 Tax=Gymnopus androsaceus JB14 TaxID=1447944 RepID=A0A6A4GE22_9AGAR|nr:hypothetical protein BT96DRAFT_1008892 [Gymnopus androsaceus JB14]